MVNLFLYAGNQEQASRLVKILLEARLVAHASISAGMETITLHRGIAEPRKEFVITAQTKAVLFEEVMAVVTKEYQDEIRIFSMPIAQCNETFSEMIRSRTKDPG